MGLAGAGRRVERLTLAHTGSGHRDEENRITGGDNHPCRVLDLVPFEEEHASVLVGLLQVEAA